jgi:HK97 family phage portal protein
VSALEWLFGAPQAKLDRLPDGAVMRVGGSNWTLVGNASNTGLPAVNEHTAQGISAVNACVKLLAGAVSSLPMNLYSMDYRTGARSQIWGDDLWWVLNEAFHPQWPAAAGWDYMMRSRLYHGDAYAVIERNGAGAVLALRPVSKSRVITYEMQNRRLVYAVLPDAKSRFAETEYYDQDDMLHVPGDGYDGIASPSVLQWELRSVAATALAQQDEAGRFFANGMKPGFLITAPNDPGPDVRAEMRQELADKYGGVRNAFKPLLLFGGMTATELSVSPGDAQLLESRKFSVEEVARIYGVPPFMIGHSEKTTSWGSGVEAMGAGFVRYTLRKHLHAFTNEFNRKLFRRGARFCEFDTSDLERPSFKEFMDALRTGVGRAGERPIMTQNEARGRFNLPPVDGGDDAGPLMSGTSNGGTADATE